jgi:CRP-like cAMP-binding protein
MNLSLSVAEFDNAKAASMSNDAVDFNLLARSGVPTRSFKQGEVIFKQGDSATELYVIQSGRVGIQFGNRLLDTLEEHNIFGEMALIDNSPRSATAVASTDVVLVPVSEKQFLFLVSQTPFFALMVMRVLARRLRAANSVM